MIVLDIESYPNFFMVAFKRKKLVIIESVGEEVSLTDHDIARVRKIMKQETFGFNSEKYDLPMLRYALQGATTEELYKLSGHIISSSNPAFVTYKELALDPPPWPHIDIFPPAPGVKISLKMYGARMHSQKLQDLPIAPGTTLTASQMQDIRLYCENDLDTTRELYEAIKPQIDLRRDMSKTYGMNLTSKGDPQIAEAVLKKALNKITGRRLKRHDDRIASEYQYTPPKYIKFNLPVLQEKLSFITAHTFTLNKAGNIVLPSELSRKHIVIGTTKYKIGVGGLHSMEKNQTVIPTNSQILADRDIASQYPSIILNEGYYPDYIGDAFLTVYRDIVEKRLHAKQIGDHTTNASLKVIINSSYGKLSNKYSILYSPGMLLQVTLTGQLTLLMLIEKLEAAGIKVVSANTDGFVALMDKDQYELYDTICFDWELTTNLVLEENRYIALHSRDINNYIALTDNGYKGKGVFTLNELTKNPTADIIAAAVIAAVSDGTPVHTTIKECTDIRKFITARGVTGGGQWRGQYLGKVVRWVYSTDGDPITYVKNGNKVALSDGALPVMDLPDSLPDTLDYSVYINKAVQLLDSVYNKAV